MFSARGIIYNLVGHSTNPLSHRAYKFSYIPEHQTALPGPFHNLPTKEELTICSIFHLPLWNKVQLCAIYKLLNYGFAFSISHNTTKFAKLSIILLESKHNLELC